MATTIRKFRRWLRQKWECATKRCEYYTDYLAYGPAELTHIGYHSAIHLANKHFDYCANNRQEYCNVCASWERRIRA